MIVKMVKDSYIVSVGELSKNITSDSVIEINEEERDFLVELFYNKPTAPDGWEYRLRKDSLEWELVKLPPEPDPEIDDTEAVSILLGGDAE